MKCSKCKRDSAVFLPYSKNNLCKKHFLELFEKRFLRTVREFNMLKKGDKVALGLSGGKDSTTLLHLLSMLQKKLPFELFAITIDIGTKCGYNKKILEISKRECKKLGVPHYIFTFKKELGFTIDGIVKRTNTENPCSFCGVFRRRILNKKARELGANKLAIGHNLDDTAQTVILNLMRNEPLRLLRFHELLITNKLLIPRIKPLTRTPEDEVVAYGKLKGLKLEAKRCCPYSKYAMRKAVRKMLDELEDEYPGTKFKIFSSFLSIVNKLREYTDKKSMKINICKNCKEPSSTEFCMYCKLFGKVKK